MKAMAYLGNNGTTIARRKQRGFSLLEVVICLSIIMIVSAIIAPRLMNGIYTVRLRYAAYDMSGAIQKARIESVRRNRFISMQQAVLPGNAIDYYVDLNGNNLIDPSDPQVVIPQGTNVFFGAGSGAPGEAAFIVSLGFVPDATGVLPRFNARGLPCIPNAANQCPALPNGGFVYFLSNAQAMGGTFVAWSSVVVTPSGRVQVWAYDGAAWNQL
jgi:prepilin-type N-terminal cleavage/methylation domain-containing protein